MITNTLYYGDNLDILQRYIKDESIDLVYLDPPFKSDQNYNILFAEQNGSRSRAQIKAFEDTWRWDQGAAEAYQDIIENGPQKVSQAMQAFRKFLGENDMLAYLSMMAPRLVELHRVLKPTGSIYLHCDPTASHYLKMLMDAMFGHRSFKNEIIWCYRLGGRPKKGWPKKHDVVLFYTTHSDDFVFNSDSVRVPYESTGGYISSGRKIVKGKEYKVNPLGKVPEDWWFISALNRQSKERLGYPTQKPETLLERMISASSNEGDVVLDPFCGCGTAIAVSQRLKRQWIGIDITHLAITLVKHRLHDAIGNKCDFKVIGEPVSLPDAATLAKADPYQFQWWALRLVGARPTEQKKGADKGIDGRIYFHDEVKGGKTKQIVLQVKGGHATASQIRDLWGVMEREKAEIAVFITLQRPTRAMRKEAASAGFYESPWGTKHPRLQILTIEELLEGKQIDYPAPKSTSRTFKKAPRAVVNEEKQRDLF